MPPHEFELDGIRIRIYPPYRTQIDPASLLPESPTPIQALTEQLVPASPQPATPQLTVDGAPSVQADGLQIDFLKESFDRTAGSQDPPIDLMFAVVNGFLERLRFVTRAASLPTRLSTKTTFFRLVYLQDDEAEFGPETGKQRARVGAGFSVQIVGLNSAVWESVAKLPPRYSMRRWDELLLDSFKLLPDVGPALVLANTMLEIRIADALDVLAAGGAVSSGLWAWINDRGDWRKEPSVAEQFDVLIRELAGVSLKDEEQLWQAFRELRSARNSFAHEGIAKIGDEPVDAGRATTLLQSAIAFGDWIESLLPPDNRRPTFETPIQLGWSKAFIEGPAVVTFPGYKAPEPS